MWSNERELEFLEYYQREPVLWKPKDGRHKDKQFVHDAWVRISEQIDIPIAQLKKKRDSLMATYRGHKRKIKGSLQSGAGAKSVYKPIWFAFDFMDSFLNDVVNCRKTVYTETDTQNPTTPPESQIRSENPNNNDCQSEIQISFPLPTILQRRNNPIKLQEAGNTMEEAMNSLNKVLNKPQVPEDDYDRYGKILANKLRKLSETGSLEMMYEIDGLFIRCLNNANNKSQP